MGNTCSSRLQLPETFDMVPKTATVRIVVLKADRFIGEMICRQIMACWRGAQVQVFQKGFDALDFIQASTPDLFVTGVQISDMDGLEHLEPFIARDTSRHTIGSVTRNNRPNAASDTTICTRRDGKGLQRSDTR